MKANIVIFQKIEKNKVFEALENNVSSLSELTRSIPSFTTVKEINSRVEKNRKSIIREHSTIALVLPEHGFSIIRIAPHGKDGIEITRIVVHESYQGKCIGNFLMNTLFLFLIVILPSYYFVESFMKRVIHFIHSFFLKYHSSFI